MQKLWPLYLRVSRPQKERQRCNSVLNWSAVIGAKLLWQKGGPGRLGDCPWTIGSLSRQNCAGQSSRAVAINIAKERLLTLSLLTEMTTLRKCGLPWEIENRNTLNCFNPLTAEWALRALIDFTLTPDDFTRQWGNPLAGKGLNTRREIPYLQATNCYVEMNWYYFQVLLSWRMFINEYSTKT